MKIVTAGIVVVGTAAALCGCRKEEKPPVAAVVVTPSVPAPVIARGGEIFREKCSACHTVNGVGGTTGPDLTGVGRRHDAAFLQTQIENPALYAKQTRMPAFKGLPRQDMDALIAYLLSLK